MKRYILFDHDGVLVDTEFWYYKAGERALADIGLTLDKDQIISRQREVRNDYYQEYLRTEAIEIEGVVETLAELSSSWISSLFVKTTSSPSRTRNHTSAGIDCAIVYNDFTKAHDFSQASYRIETLIELKDIILR